MPIESYKLAELLDRYWPVLVAWVPGARADAEDVVQAAFVKLAAEDPPPCNCVAWLFTVTKRLAINELKSQQRRRAREKIVASQRQASPGSQAMTADLEIMDLLDALLDREREVVIARVWGELTFGEIGLALNESKATVWRDYQSAIENLKHAYQYECNE